MILKCLADLIRPRNANQVEITRVIGRPALLGHVGESITGRIFDIALEALADNPDSDGRFRSGPLSGKSVNIKMYDKRDGRLDIGPDDVPDFCVVPGPRQ